MLHQFVQFIKMSKDIITLHLSQSTIRRQENYCVRYNFLIVITIIIIIILALILTEVLLSEVTIEVWKTDVTYLLQLHDGQFPVQQFKSNLSSFCHKVSSDGYKEHILIIWFSDSLLCISVSKGFIYNGSHNLCRPFPSAD